MKGSLPPAVLRFVSSSQPLVLATMRLYLKKDKGVKGRRIAASVTAKGFINQKLLILDIDVLDCKEELFLIMKVLLLKIEQN